MNKNHVIARCSWQTEFDQENGAHELQNFISRWSNEVLPKELDRCFNELCPSTQTWRIDALQLDVGDIPLADLPEELPRRIRENLRDALDQMLTHQHVSYAPTSEDKFQILDATKIQEELIIWFLSNGTLPWWFKGKESAMQILDELTCSQAQAMARIIRDQGRSVIVRQRIVRQCGELRMRNIVHLLEPWQGDFICCFADNLFVVQAQRHIPQTGTSEYREHIWLNILTFLLVDRGSLFNTIEFVRTNLRQTAQYYRLDYSILLHQMFAAVHALEPQGLIMPAFSSAIKALYTQDMESPQPAGRENRKPLEPWVVLQHMLHGCLDHYSIGLDTVKVGELFAALAQRDSARLATLLRAEGKAASVRRGILEHFAFEELALLVQVLEPHEQPFIVGYVRHTQIQAELLHWNTKNVWQVVLAYLLAGGSARFSRRQLVSDTVQGLCRLYKLEPPRLLNLLMHTLHDQYPRSYQLELLDIFQDLKVEQVSYKPEVKVRSMTWHAVLRYLETGRLSVSSKVRAQLLEFSKIQTLAEEGEFGSLLRAPALHSTSDTVLSQRLLQLAGVADLPLLFNLIEAGSSEVCMTLLTQFATWYRQGWLPCLDKLDVAFQLPALLVQALPGFRTHTRPGKFDISAFGQKITRLLQRYGVDLRSLSRQLQPCLGQLVQPAQTGLRQVLQMFITEQADARRPLPQAKMGSSGPWTPTQLLLALRMHLAAPLASREKEMPEALRALPSEAFWPLIIRMDGRVISEWLVQQPDQLYLLTQMGRSGHMQLVQHSLSAQLPTGLGSQEETLKHLSRLFQESGNWQGATAVLEQQLQTVFWSVALCGRGSDLSGGELLAAVVSRACMQLDVALSGCMESFSQQTHLLQEAHWREAYDLLCSRTLHKIHPNADKATPASAVCKSVESRLPGAEFQQDPLARYLDHPALVSILRHLLKRGRLPASMQTAQHIDLRRLLFDLFTFRPAQLADLLRDMPLRPDAMFRLTSIVPFAWLVDAMHATVPDRQAVTVLHQFQQLMEPLVLPGSTRQQRSILLFQMVLKHWLNKDWAALAPDRLVPSYLWQWMGSYPLSRSVLYQHLTPCLANQPPTLRQILEHTLIPESAKSICSQSPDATLKYRSGELSGGTPAAKKLAALLKTLQAPPDQAAPIAVFNCGLVLLQSYIPMLFSRLGLVDDQKFVTPVAQRRAVHLLQFLVTGGCKTAEEYLVLNKLLCGLALLEPVELGIEISTHEEEVCRSLLKAVIGYWDAISGSSIEGLQGNWLVRNGSLNHATDHWDLIVEKRIYDLLLARSPFSYSVIKFPWMEQAIYVTWPTG